MNFVIICQSTADTDRIRRWLLELGHEVRGFFDHPRALVSSPIQTPVDLVVVDQEFLDSPEWISNVFTKEVPQFIDLVKAEDGPRLLDASSTFSTVSSLLKPLNRNRFFVTLKGAVRLHERERELHSVQQQMQSMKVNWQISQEKILQKERMHTLSQMTAGIAHNFNNILTPILGYSDLLLSPKFAPTNPDTKVLFLEKIRHSAREAAKMVKALMDFNRPFCQTDSFSFLDLNQIVEETIEFCRPIWHDQALSRNLSITIKKQFGCLPALSGNSVELKTAIANILCNAVESIPGDHGVVEFATEFSKEEVVLRISDSGQGMSTEVLQHCFDPFYTTKVGQGTGLGLSMVFGAMQRHEGYVQVQSTEGSGSHFFLKFPQAHKSKSVAQPVVLTTQKPYSPKKSATPLPVEQEEAPRSGLRFLLVEDDPEVLEFLQTWLQRQGHWIRTATNGTEALREFQTHDFDIVLCDRAIPEGNGDQVSRRLKELVPQQTIWMMSGFPDEIPPQDPEGVFISKPLSTNELKEKINAFSKTKAKVAPKPRSARTLQPA